MTGRAVPVTGGSRGNGAAIVRELAGRGVRVAAVGEAPQRWGRPESVIANGVWTGGRPASLDATEWCRVDSLEGTAQLSSGDSPPRRSQRLGHQDPAPVVGPIGGPGDTAHASAKAGSHGFGRALAKELARDNLRVNLLAPGFVETDTAAETAATSCLAISRSVLLRRFGNAEEVASPAVFLGEDATYCTGSIFSGWWLVVMKQANVGMRAQDYVKLRERIFSAIWNELDRLEGEIEDTERLPLDRIMPVLKEVGAFGLIIPREFGGSGMSMTQYLPIIAEFAKIHGGIRCLVHVHNSFAHALSEIGTEEQKQAVLPGAAVGERSVAFALTEPDYGTGADLGSTATKTDSGYLINGKKHLITNSHIATEFMYFAKTGSKEVSAFLVPKSSPGLSVVPMPETMGCKGGEHGEVTLVDVEVPRSALIGEEGQGIDNLEAALEISRVFIAASSLGTSQRALELSLEHAKSRITFGKPLEARQAIQRYLAEMAVDVQALGLMLADAARKADKGLRIPAEASMAKQFGLEAVARVTDRALLIHGGIGYTRKTPIERLYRDARLNWLEEGPPTIQYMVTAGQLIDGYQFCDPFAEPYAET